jgi:hypothetical protein
MAWGSTTITNPFATTTNTAPSISTTSPSTSTTTTSNNPFTTQYPTTSNGNFGPFQNLNPNGIINNGSTGTGSNTVNNNGLISPQQ